MPGIFGGGSDDDNYGQAPGLGGMSNSLIGLGMGLLQPYNPWAGTNAWTNALQGYQAGSALDARRAQQAQELAMQRQRMALAKSEAARQAGQWQQDFELRKQQLARGDVTEAQKAFKDIYGDAPVDTEAKNKFFRDWYQPKTEGDWILVDGPPDANGNPTKVEWNKRTGEKRPFVVSGVGGAGGGAAPPVVMPGTTLYWGGPGEAGQSAPSTTGAGGAAPQSQLPPEIQSIPNYAARQKAMEEYYKKQVTQAVKDPQQETAAKTAASNVLTALDTAEKLVVNKGGLLPTTGVVGGKLGPIYQPSADLSATLNTIAANVSLEKLNAMRQASTTGASGLGAVTEPEHRMLMNSIAALEQSQGQDQLLANLKRVRATYDWVINRPDKNQPPPFVMQPSQPTTTGGGGTGGTTKSGIKWTVQ